MSLVLGLGLEHSCPWPRECLSSERLSLALDFFVFLALALASSLVSSTPPSSIIQYKDLVAAKFYREQKGSCLTLSCVTS